MGCFHSSMKKLQDSNEKQGTGSLGSLLAAEIGLAADKRQNDRQMASVSAFTFWDDATLMKNWK